VLFSLAVTRVPVTQNHHPKARQIHTEAYPELLDLVLGNNLIKEILGCLSFVEWPLNALFFRTPVGKVGLSIQLTRGALLQHYE
jgi:hypothetical protein